MGLFDIFKKKDNANGPIPGTLFYHEDDYCMVELTPIDNLNWLKQELNNASESSEKHFDGYGWTKMYVIKEHAVKLYSRKINPDRLLEIIRKTNFTQAPAVTTGYGSTTREDCPNTYGFGEGYSAIYFSTMFDSVDKIWFTNLFALDREKVINLLHEIGKEWDLVLVDWFQHTITSLADKESIKNYFDSDN
jgi:hypothetical protein